MANGFADGYFGMQVNSDTERRILFSVWSPSDESAPAKIPEALKIKLQRKGIGVTVGEFGNEGAGGQSYLNYSWEAATTYRFLINAKPTSSRFTAYTTYFCVPHEGRWRLIASFLRPETRTHLKSLSSFLENFNPNFGDLERLFCLKKSVDIWSWKMDRIK